MRALLTGASRLLILVCTSIAASRGSLLDAEAVVPVARPTARFAITVWRDDRDGVCLESRAVIAAVPTRVLQVLIAFDQHPALSASPTLIRRLRAVPQQ